MSETNIIIHLTPEDVAETRFAFSPALELATSYQMLMKAKPDARFRFWMDEMRRALYGLEFPYLQALTSSYVYIPDFLTPTPLAPGMTIEAEIEQIMATPDEIVRKNILSLIEAEGETEILRQYLTYPREMLYCLSDELRLYWGRTLMRHWPRMKSVLEEDILYRGRNLALGGYRKLFEDLSPAMSYQRGAIRVTKKRGENDYDVQLKGSGLQLVPAIFSSSVVMWQIVPEWHPMVIYVPRGTGLWWREPPQTPDQSLEIALGAGRARVLQALVTPASTGELARRLNLTDGAVSQHLSRLRQAGLVESQRSAKKVYYSLTSRGAQLLLLFDGKYDAAVKNAG